MKKDRFVVSEETELVDDGDSVIFRDTYAEGGEYYIPKEDISKLIKGLEKFQNGGLQPGAKDKLEALNGDDPSIIVLYEARNFGITEETEEFVGMELVECSQPDLVVLRDIDKIDGRPEEYCIVREDIPKLIEGLKLFMDGE
jgi:hypothetical protein